MRILHLGKYYPPDTGGIESINASLARGAVAAGMNATVLCFANHAVHDEVDNGVVVHRVLQTRKVASQPLSAAYIRRAADLARDADVVHVHTPNMLAALAVLRLPGTVRILIHWHSDVVGKGLLGQVLRPLERAMLSRADCIVATSRAYADASASLAGYAAKIRVIPLGVDAATTAPRQDRRDLVAALPPALRPFADGRPLVLSVGRLVRYKGYAVLIDAVHRMRVRASFIIVGAGPLHEDLQARIDARGLQDRIILAGRLSDSTLEHLRLLADVYCMPSIERSEAFGVALIEAMASRMPLVATCISGSGVPWVNLQDESGLNVKPADPQALAKALDRLLEDDTLRARLADGARARYEQLFTERAMVVATLNLYRDIMVKA